MIYTHIDQAKCYNYIASRSAYEETLPKSKCRICKTLNQLVYAIADRILRAFSTEYCKLNPSPQASPILM